MQKIVKALEKTLMFLRQSEDSLLAKYSVSELIETINTQLDKARTFQQVEAEVLRKLFAPTSSLQEISMANGWGNEFIEISRTIDQL